MTTNFLSPLISDQFFLLFVEKVGKMYNSQNRVIRKVAYNRARWSQRAKLQWEATHNFNSRGRIPGRDMANKHIPLGNVWWEKRNGILVPKNSSRIILEEGVLDG